MKVVVVGSGITGLSAARILTDCGHSVEIFESRSHIGGNCHDERQNGVTVHRYGPHLFHTNDAQVWGFLSQFTEWSDYCHKVVADTNAGRISIPFSDKTREQLGRDLTDEEIRNLIFVEYSEKQWGVPWVELPAAITGRVPTRRTGCDDRYFTDIYQGQPKNGYAAMFLAMSSGISCHLGAKPEDWKRACRTADLTIYTGKIDEYFGYKYGRLPYRSLRFEHEWSRQRLPHAVINQCNSLPYTRIYDHACFSGEFPQETVLTREYPEAHDDGNDPYYPMPFGEGMTLYQQYKLLTGGERETIFLGRLASYSYLDMWMAVAQVMKKLKFSPQTAANHD